MKAPASTLRRPGGFSLVEVTIAIGIFAFVVVGVLGLFPTAMKMRRDASAETRAVMAAQEVFASINAAPDIRNVTLRRGTKSEDVMRVNFATGAAAFGYSIQSAVPFFGWWSGSERAEYQNPEAVWRSGSGSDSAVLGNSIDMLVFVTATNVPNAPNLFRVTVQARSPVDIPLTNASPVTFTSFVYSP